jgi:sugar transferase (PEP-CTERM/EpsH1 system associated)
MKNLLFLVHRIPFPPNKGDKIRSFNMLQQLSKNYNVFLAGFIDKDEDWDYVDELGQYCEEVYFRPVNRWRSLVSTAFSLIRRRSLSVGFYSDKALRHWVENVLHSHEFDAAIAFSSSMTQFLPYEMLEESVIVADFVDLDSDKWRQYAAETKWPLSSVYKYESKALAKWEMDTVELVDAVTLVSSAERELLFEHSGERLEKIKVVRNGVDTRFFDPTIELESPYEPRKRIAVFTGAMDYFANAQGVQRFAEEIWPEVKKNVPSAEFWIVGGNPGKDVEALQAVEGVVVTGYVDDIRPYLKHSNVVVVPLQLARGVQNKVLEALAMDLPVLATPQALQGLDGALPGSATSISDADIFSEEVCRALTIEIPSRDGGGREYVCRNYDWESNLAEIGHILADVAEDKVGASGRRAPDK